MKKKTIYYVVLVHRDKVPESISRIYSKYDVHVGWGGGGGK